MTFNEWMESVPDVIKGDPVWKVEAYRLALFAGDLAWVDVTKLVRDKRTISMEVIKSLLTIIPNERGFSIREESATYLTVSSPLLDDVPSPDP